MSERWPDENLAGFEIRYGHSDETGEGTPDPATAGETTETADQGNETDGADTAANAAGDGSETEDGGSNGAETASDGPPDCDFGDWPPDDVETHDVRLVNRKEDETDDQGETAEENTTLYVSADVDAESDAPYLINTFERCETDYVGVELVSVEGAAVEREDDPVEVEEDPNDAEAVDDETPAQGPGFGLLATLATILGLGHLLGRRRTE